MRMIHGWKKKILHIVFVAMTIRLVDNTDSSPSENFFPITSSEDFRLIHLLTAATDAAKAAARNVVCNMTIAFPVLSTLTPSPWSCAAALNVVGSWCNFTGIDCKPSVSPNPQLYILNIDLSGRHLVGRIPSALGQLSSLQSLALSSNQISGTIPSSLASLSTSLTGSIVRLLFSSMKNQRYSHLPVHPCLSLPLSLLSPALFVNQNSLIGTVPNSLTRLTKLQYLNVNYNYLTGTLPSYFSTNTFNNASASVYSTFVELRYHFTKATENLLVY